MGLQELNFIVLRKPKWPEEVSKFDEPNFCHYHRILSHTLKDCFVVKDLIQKLIDEGTIDANLLKSMKKEKEVATPNVTTFKNNLAICNGKFTKARLSFDRSTPQDAVISPSKVKRVSIAALKMTCSMTNNVRG